MGRLKILFRAFRDVAWEHDEARNDYHRLAEESHEHLAIVEALLAGDRPGGRPRHGAAHSWAERSTGAGRCRRPPDESTRASR